MKCSDGQCHECCDDEDCEADEVCTEEYTCRFACEMEPFDCHSDRGGCCDGEVCDQFLDRCVGMCGSDEDCWALHADLPFGSDLVCQDDHVCDFQHCAVGGDCRAGTVCFDGDCVASTCGLGATCVIAPGFVVVGNGTSARMVAWPLLRSGGLAPGVDFTWASSDENIASAVDGVVTGGPDLGLATITATAVDCSFACTAEVRNLSGFAASTRVVVVDEMSGHPVPLAAVEIEGCCTAETDSAGVATLDEPYLPGSPATVTISAAGYGQLSFMQAATSDIIAPLRRLPKPPVVGGFRGQFGFDRILCEPGNPCEVKVGLAGSSIPGNPFSLTPAELYGALVSTHIELGGTSEDTPLPSGLVLGLNDTWFREAFQVVGAPGLRVGWGFGGKINLADLIEGLGRLIAEGELDYGYMQNGLIPLLREFHTGLVAGLPIEPLPMVPDADDLDGDGDFAEWVPDFAEFPGIPGGELVLKVPAARAMTVSVPALPADGAGGYLYDLVVVIGGVRIAGAGFVPLGVSAGFDQAEGGVEANGQVTPIELAIADVAGRLPAGSYQRVVVALGVSLDRWMDKENQDPFALAGQIHPVDGFDGALTLRPFMPPAVRSFDPSARRVTFDSLPDDTDAVLMVGRRQELTWQILHPGALGPLDLPPEPAGGERLDRLDVAALRFADGVGYQDLLAFDGTSLADLANVVADFAVVFGTGVWREHSDTPLPFAHFYNIPDCIPQQPPSWELWAGRADAVVLGTVAWVEPVTEPAYAFGGCGCIETAEECLVILQEGLRVGLERVTTLFGTPVGDELELTYGNSITSDQCPGVFADDSGVLVWVDGQCPGRRVEPGQRIGGALFQDPEDGRYWGPQRAGVLFQVDADGIIHEQDYLYRDCYAHSPVGMDGMPLTALRTLLASLDLSDPELQEELAGWADWGGTLCQRLYRYWGATCFGTEDCPYP